MKKYTTFRDEVVLYSSKKEEILVSVRHPTCIDKRMLVAIASNGFNTDYPIYYGDGRVGWDNPEWFSKAFIKNTKEIIRLNS